MFSFTGNDKLDQLGQCQAFLSPSDGQPTENITPQTTDVSGLPPSHSQQPHGSLQFLPRVGELMHSCLVAALAILSAHVTIAATGGSTHMLHYHLLRWLCQIPNPWMASPPFSPQMYKAGAPHLEPLRGSPLTPHSQGSIHTCTPAAWL